MNWKSTAGLQCWGLSVDWALSYFLGAYRNASCLSMTEFTCVW